MCHVSSLPPSGRCDWAICAPAANLSCGSHISGSLSGIEPSFRVTRYCHHGSIHHNQRLIGQLLIRLSKQSSKRLGILLSLIFNLSDFFSFACLFFPKSPAFCSGQVQSGGNGLWDARERKSRMGSMFDLFHPQWRFKSVSSPFL